MPLSAKVALFVSLIDMTYKHFRKIQVTVLILLAIFIFNKNFQLILQTRSMVLFPDQSYFSINLVAKNGKNEINTKEVAQKRLFNSWSEGGEGVFDQYIKEKQSKSFSKQSALLASGIYGVKRLIKSLFSIFRYCLVSVKDWYYRSTILWQIHRLSFLKILEGHLDSRSLPLAKGLLFGDVSGIDRDTYHSFKVIGILHILSASGANFILVIQFFLLLCKPILPFLTRKQHFWLHFCLGTVYFGLVGGGSAPSRAYLSLVLSAYLGFYCRRTSSGLYSLVIIGFFMLIINPFQLMTLGFQLSFLASFGLLFFGEKLEISSSINKNYLFRNLLTTASAQFFLTPILIGNFSEFNYMTFLANMLILPLVELLTILFLVLYMAIFIQMLCSFDFFVRFLAIFISKIVDILFTLIEILNKIPYKIITFEGNKERYIILFTVICCATIFVFELRNRKHHSKNSYRVFQ